MAATKYTYAIIADFTNDKINSDKMTVEINGSAIVTALSYITTIGDVCDIWFDDALSGGDETILDGLVAAHDGDPIPARCEITGTVIDTSCDRSHYKVMTENTTFTAINPIQGAGVTIELTGNYTVTWPSSFEIISGEYDGAKTNVVFILAANAATPKYWVTISQEP